MYIHMKTICLHGISDQENRNIFKFLSTYSVLCQDLERAIFFLLYRLLYGLI